MDTKQLSRDFTDQLERDHGWHFPSGSNRDTFEYALERFLDEECDFDNAVTESFQEGKEEGRAEGAAEQEEEDKQEIADLEEKLEQTTKELHELEDELAARNAELEALRQPTDEPS